LGPEWIKYMSDLSKYMKFQEKKITRLENLILELEDDLNEMKNNKTPSIEKVEYKFDQLKIETLEGTLNIGLTPNGESMLEDFQVQNKEISISQQHSKEMKERIQHHLFQFIDEEGMKHLLELERTYNENFDEKYRGMIIDDIRKQVPQRINENIKKITQKDPTLEKEQLEHAVTASIKNEIITGLQSFVKHKPKGED
jgi:spore germination protein PC